MKLNALHHWLIIFCVSISIVFTIFRFSFLYDIPKGFFVDESSIAYNALSILRTGTDEHGATVPLYFKAFGDYKNPLFVYSVVPLLALFGSSITSVRLASALWGAAALGMFIFFLRRAHFPRKIVFFAAFILLTNPWFVQLSRVAFEVASVPFFLFTAVVSFYLLSEEKNLSTQKTKLWLFVFATSLAGAFYAYTATRMIAPLAFGMGLLMIYKKIGWKLFWGSGLLFALYLLPLFASQSVSEGALAARYAVVGLSNYTHSAGDFFFQFLNNYVHHFSPHFLWNGGDGNLRHVPSPYGIFYLTSIPFIIFGCIELYKKRKHVFYNWLFFLLLLSPIPSALTIQSPHVLRSVSFITLLFVVAAFGVRWCMESPGWKKTLAHFFIFLIGIESLFFLYFYTHVYVQNSRPWFDAGTVEILQGIPQYQKPVYLSKNLYVGTYATALFLGKDISPLGFDTVSNPGSYILDLNECLLFEHAERAVFFSRIDATCALVVPQQ